MTLKLGQFAPEFELPSHLGGQVELEKYRGKNTLLAFFPQAWTPV